MSDPIAEVIRNHYPIDDAARCFCGFEIRTVEQWAEHLTAAIRDAPGLRQEWTVEGSDADGEWVCGRSADKRADAESWEVATRSGAYVATRFVTDWRPADE